MNRKFKKLLRDPKLFVKDMVVKHGRKMGVLSPDPETLGHYQYTVVSAVYNVGRYLDDFFNSLVKQKLDFKRHIHLIMVDDGSTDNSAEVIKGWQKKYPDNITYIWKENGGQASARNLGLTQVKTEWVTFTDPDDFLDTRFFKHIDNALKKYHKEEMAYIASNIICFEEGENKFKNTHPLSFRFSSKKTCLLDVKDEKSVQLSAASAIFSTALLKKARISFPENVKPTFEDAFFIASLTLHFRKFLLVPEAKYLYRRRQEQSSTVDTSWENPDKYNTIFENGYLALLENAKEQFGFVPENIQRTVFYDLAWYIKRFVFHGKKFQSLPENLQIDLKSNLKKSLTLINNETILKFNIAGFWWFYKYGTLAFKGEPPKSGHALYIHAVNEKKKTIEIGYFFDSTPFMEEIFLDGKETFPITEKTITHKLCGDVFLNERKIWIQYNHNNQIIAGKLNNITQNISISAGGKNNTSHKILDIINHYGEVITKKRSALKVPERHVKFDNCWLMMDRDYKADDNAEHLYRYIKKNHPEVNPIFAIRKTSPDWYRLDSDGFNLVDYDSHEFYDAIRACKKFISSHNSPALVRKFEKDILFDKDFIFLQHGVIHTDLSSAFNHSKIDLLITSAPREYLSIAGSENRYKFSPENVALTGLPRHDSLLNDRQSRNNSIVIMPTWREYLSGKFTGDGLTREIREDFLYSEYTINWLAILKSPALLAYSKKFDLKIKFYPHAEILPYIGKMDFPNHIEIMADYNGSIQDVFHSAAIFITDYSSVAFEAALLNKNIIYFHFDSERFFSEHNTPGYFDYKKDGFGPVFSDANSLIEYITSINNPHLVQEEYKSRQFNFFAFHDQNNCLRVFNAIKALDEAYPSDLFNCHVLHNSAIQASHLKLWVQAEQRWRLLIERGNEQEQASALLPLAEALREQGKLAEAQATLARLDTLTTDTNTLQERARLAMARHDWMAATDLWQQVLPEQAADRLQYLRCLVESQCFEACEAYLQDEWAFNLPAHHKALLEAWRAVAAQDRHAAFELLEASLEAYSIEELSLLKPELLLARYYREQAMLDQSQNQLVAYEKHTSNDPQCRVQIALLAQGRGQWNKVIDQLQKAYVQLTDMPQPLAPIYAQSLRQLGKEKEAEQAIVQWLKQWPDNLALRQHAAELMLKNQRWEEAMLLLPTLFTSSQDALRQALLPMIATLRGNGKLTQAETLFEQCFGQTGKCVQVWSDAIRHERANLHMARQQWLQVLCCLDCMEEQTPFDLLMQIQSLAELGYVAELEALLYTPVALGQEASLRQLALAWHCVALHDWSKAASLLLAEIGSWSTEDLRTLQPQLLLARCLREQGLLDAAHAQLAAFEKHSANHPQCRVQIALLASARGQWDKVLAQISRAYPTLADQPDSLLPTYILALRMQKKMAEAEQVLQALLPSHPNNQELQIEAARLATDCSFWSQAIIRWSHLLSITAEAPFKLAEAYRMTGQLEQAFITLTAPSCRTPANVAEWKLKAEIAQLTNQWDQAVECWAALIQYYPDQADQENWERLNSVQIIKALKDNNMPSIT